VQASALSQDVTILADDPLLINKSRINWHVFCSVFKDQFQYRLFLATLSSYHLSTIKVNNFFSFFISPTLSLSDRY